MALTYESVGATMRYNTILAFLIVTLGVIGFAVPAFGQNTGGVFGPVVNDGHRSAQYRITVNPDSNGFAQRLHYQQAINGDLMWRVIGATKKTASSDFDFDFAQAELFWQITPDGQDYQTGLRFDAKLRDGSRPEQLGLNWMNQWKFDDGWTARALVLTAVQLGDNSADGLFLQTRGNIVKKLDGGQSVGFELYNNLGNTENLGSFKTQGHTAGPFVSTPIGGDFSIYAGALFGLSKAAPDTELRLWLTKKL